MPTSRVGFPYLRTLDFFDRVWHTKSMTNQQTMDTTTIQDILNLIAQAEAAREMALREENRDEFGYPFVAGYTTSTLAQIRQRLITVAQ